MSSFRKIPILAYHKVDRSFEWGVTRLYPSQFAEQMRFLRRKGYSSVTLTGAFQSGSIKCVAITFDDAYKELLENAISLMIRYSFTATIFVVTNFVGKENLWDVNLGFRKFKHMDWSVLRSLCDAGFEIGSHTHTHPDLTKISEVRIREELTVSKNILESKLGVPVRFVSYPFGRYSRRIKEIVEESGYSGAVCLSHPFRRKDGLFEIERQSVYIIDSLDNFKAKLGIYGSAGFMFEKMKGRTINFFAGATHIIKMIQSKYEKDRHDEEI
ncbi:MAG: polysaccharide deacetylase family protein [Candidatus Cloacimonadota bacterium]|nr:MAG: polysaccharide deacetylase family protein [Candidatus Cloacimonadota bacterium]